MKINIEDKIQYTGQDFWQFLNENNVISIGIAFIIAMQVNALGTSFVDSIISPIINAILGDGEDSLAEQEFVIFGIEFKFGLFIASLIKFALFMFIIYIIFSVSGIRKIQMASKK